MGILKKILRKPYHFLRWKAECLVSLSCISRNSRRLRAKIRANEKLNVLFLIQYIPAWNKLEPVYQRMLEDDRFHPTIVCLPMEIENHRLTRQDCVNETYEYFVSKGIPCVNCLCDDGSWLDLHQFEPDYVFHSRPYNGFLPEPYTSGQLMRYTLVCNVLYGINTARNWQESILRSEYYADTYFFFASDQKEKEYYDQLFRLGIGAGIQRCEPYGAVGLEQMLRARTKKRPSPFRKTVLWTPRWSTDPVDGGSNFFRYVHTIRKLIAENPEVFFVIRPHPLMFSNFIKTGEMSEQEAAEFRSFCETTANVRLDEDKEYADAFWNSDILITDNSSIVPEYFVTEKPIIFCHSDIFVYTEGFTQLVASTYQVHTAADIEKHLSVLLSGEDPMKEARIRTIRQLYADAVEDSGKILNALYG